MLATLLHLKQADLLVHQREATSRRSQLIRQAPVTNKKGAASSIAGVQLYAFEQQAFTLLHNVSFVHLHGAVLCHRSTPLMPSLWLSHRNCNSMNLVRSEVEINKYICMTKQPFEKLALSWDFLPGALVTLGGKRNCRIASAGADTRTIWVIQWRKSTPS